MTTSPDTHTDYIAGTWKLDPTHSEISFSVKHLKISKVRGSFKIFDATIVTAENPADSTVEAIIEVASVDTNQKDRDAHLRGDDFFAVEQFPTLTFNSTAIRNRSGQHYDVSGDLTIRGHAKPVVLSVEFLGKAKDPWGNEKLAFDVEVTINRKDFGLSWNTALETGGFLVGDDVRITIALQAA